MFETLAGRLKWERTADGIRAVIPSRFSWFMLLSSGLWLLIFPHFTYEILGKSGRTAATWSRSLISDFIGFALIVIWIAMFRTHKCQGATGPSPLGTGDDTTMMWFQVSRECHRQWGSFKVRLESWRVATVSVICSNPDEGATGPSPLGTGDDTTMMWFQVSREYHRHPCKSLSIEKHEFSLRALESAPFVWSGSIAAHVSLSADGSCSQAEPDIHLLPQAPKSYRRRLSLCSLPVPKQFEESLRSRLPRPGGDLRDLAACASMDPVFVFPY